MTDTALTRPAAYMSLRDWSMLFFLGLLWGGSFFFARVAVFEIAPLTLVFLRVAIAALALQLYLLARGPSFAIALPMAGAFFGMALLNNAIPFSLLFVAQTELGAGLASVLNATTPFWTILLANLSTTDERLSANKLAGIALGIAGAAVMIGPGLVAGLGGPVWAKVTVVAAALSYALAVVFARRFRALPAQVVATGQLTAAAILMLPVMLLVDGLPDVAGVTPVTWSAVLALALASTALAYILYFALVASAGSTNTSLVTLIVPAFAILLGTVILGERLALFEIAGMALIGCGLLTIDGRIFRRRTLL